VFRIKPRRAILAEVLYMPTWLVEVNSTRNQRSADEIIQYAGAVILVAMPNLQASLRVSGEISEAFLIVDRRGKPRIRNVTNGKEIYPRSNVNASALHSFATLIETRDELIAPAKIAKANLP